MYGRRYKKTWGRRSRRGSFKAGYYRLRRIISKMRYRSRRRSYRRW